MNDDKMITQNDIDSTSVRLRPILGMPPRKYLPAFYTIALLAILFMVFVYPGIRKPGTTWTFLVDPPGSAVYVDGAYRGSAPCSVFIRAGEHSVTITRPGFADFTQPLTSKGRVIATLLVRPRAQLAVSLVQAPDSLLLEDGMRHFASWALAGSPSESYQIPMVLSDAARAASSSPGTIQSMGFAGAAVSYAAHAQSLRDAIRAVSIAYGRSAALTPATLARLVSEISLEMHDDPSMITALVLHPSTTFRSRLESIPAFQALLASAVTVTAGALSAGAGPRSVVSDQEFVTMLGGHTVITAGASLPANVAVAPFRMASSETTVGQFRRFIEDHPEWAPESAESLTSRGLADDDYLKGYAESDPKEVLTYVSRPAAIAYCEWLTKTAPIGYRFSLPTEAQWSFAAAASNASAGRNALFSDLGATGPLNPDQLPADSAGFRGLLGNVWEWCSDSYATHPSSGRTGRERFSSIESVVRSGSWANRSDLVSLSSRGPMQESACSAYVGFRVALVAVTER